MADAFIPYAPLNTLKPAAGDVWIADGPEIRMTWLKLPFATRMTVIRLPDGALWLHSPIAVDPGLIEQIRELGRVAHLVAPNTLHYWWLPDWADLFPDATVWLAPKLAQRAKRSLPPHQLLTEEPPHEWQGAFDQVIADSPLLTEVDFFHRPSRTAILTDLIENFEPARVRSHFWRFAIRRSGAADPDGKAPIDMRMAFRRNRNALRRAVETMLGWNPERVILAHGRWYDRGGAAELRRAFRWAL